MFKISCVRDDRLDIEMSGKLDTEHMEIVLDELVSKSEGIEHGKMLYDVIDYHLPSLGAIRLEFTRLLPMLKLVKKFDRAAVLTDKKWLRIISEIEGALYPGLEFKAFTRDQKAEAEAWLSN